MGTVGHRHTTHQPTWMGLHVRARARSRCPRQAAVLDERMGAPLRRRREPHCGLPPPAAAWRCCVMTVAPPR